MGGQGGGLGCCPFTRSASVAGSGIKGVVEGEVLYLTSSLDCRALSDFYGFCSRILSSSEADANSGIFTVPSLSWPDFLLFTEACKFGLDFSGAGELIQLVHFHPSYTRSSVEPADSLHYGHLPPTSWLNPMAAHLGQPPVDQSLASYQDFQRRSPFPMINVLRGDQLAKATVGTRVQR